MALRQLVASAALGKGLRVVQIIFLNFLGAHVALVKRAEEFSAASRRACYALAVKRPCEVQRARLAPLLHSSA